MRRACFILIISLVYSCSLSGQKFEYGIQYAPIQLSMVSFDQKYIIFADYSSIQVYKPRFRLSAPSLSNSGLFVRYNYNKYSFQTGLNLQNNVYFYGKRIYDYTISSVSVHYSSIDIPITACYNFRNEEKKKVRIILGIDNKLLKIRRSYYSIFARRLEYLNYVDATASDAVKRKFMVDKIRPYIVYLRTGIGIKHYNVTTDLYLDRNITPMNRYIDKYNANYKNTYQINLSLGYSIAPKNLKNKKYRGKIDK